MLAEFEEAPALPQQFFLDFLFVFGFAFSSFLPVKGLSLAKLLSRSKGGSNKSHQHLLQISFVLSTEECIECEQRPSDGFAESLTALFLDEDADDKESL